MKPNTYEKKWLDVSRIVMNGRTLSEQKKKRLPHENIAMDAWPRLWPTVLCVSRILSCMLIACDYEKL